MMQKELSKDDVKQASNGSGASQLPSTTQPATAPSSAAGTPTHSLTTSLSSSPIIAPAVPPSSSSFSSLPLSASSTSLNLTAPPTATASVCWARLRQPPVSHLLPPPQPAQPTDPVSACSFHHHLLPLERMLRVMSSPSPQLIQTFRKVWPKGQSSLLQEMMDLRGLTSRDQERLVKVWNVSVGDKSSKRIEWVQRDFMTNFFGDIKKSIQTNL